MDIHIDPSQASKPLKCNLCDYTCKYDHILSEHMETHTGEKSFQCQKRSSQPNVLHNDHINIQTQKEGNSFINDTCKIVDEQVLAHVNEILLHCTECDYKCRNKDILLSHLKSHNVYACGKCDFRGISSKGLTAHMKTHKLKQFKCTKCEYTVNTFSKLNTHMRNHTGEAITAESLFEIVTSQTSDKTPLKSNTAKRGLSVSPEVVNTDKKSISDNSSNKKTKN